MRNLTIYQAGPITGCSYKGCTDWRKRLREEFPEFTWLSPMRYKPHLEGCELITKEYNGDNPLKQLLSGSRGINSRDSWDVRNCDIVFANLEAEGVSIGTVMEIAWGFILNKIVIAVKPYDHPMLRECINYPCPDMSVAIEVLKALR